MAVTVPHERALAKVNLYLHVTGRRADGYHELDSLAVFGPAFDSVALGDGPAPLTIAGAFAAGLSGEADNLVARAARLLEAETGRAAPPLTLHKTLPVASGVGGGSADAAATLRLLSRHWGVQPDLHPIALRLGADVPVCLASRPCRMRGIGERLDPAPALPPCGALLVNPGVPVATADVFRARTGAFSQEAELPTAWPTADALVATLRATRNDLEAPAIGLCPVIAEVLAALRATEGCLLARMSGSGATCFALYPDPAQAARAADALPGRWWRHAGGW